MCALASQTVQTALPHAPAKLERACGVQERLAAAKRWLERQPEKVVFMYGHSVFWKTFFAHSESLANCEYRIIHW